MAAPPRDKSALPNRDMRRQTLDAFTLAVGPGGIYVVFQPIVDLATRESFA